MAVPDIAATYNAAADHLEHPSLTHWGYFGGRTVARAALRAGEYVLDVCCGAGASALPAARAVGPGGRVIGIDLAEASLKLARGKAAAEGLANVEFRQADFDKVYFRPASFDAVVCVFGVFFFPDMAAALKKMWRLLRAGGRLAVTTWGPDLFEPGNTLFWDAVRRERPELYRRFNPWDSLTTPERQRALFDQAGIGSGEVDTEDYRHPIATADDWWALVMGSGYRGTVDQLTDAQRERVREACLGFDAGSVRAAVVYGMARKTG